MLAGETPNYAIVGDDIVICSSKAASIYLDIMRTLGVEISLSKSMISEDGKSFEFVKRVFLKGEDVSPISWGTLTNQYHMDPLEFLARLHACQSRLGKK